MRCSQYTFRKGIHPENPNKPCLLFVTFSKDETTNMVCVEVRGIRNPLPFKKTYGIRSVDVISWLKANGWEQIGTTLWN